MVVHRSWARGVQRAATTILIATFIQQQLDVAICRSTLENANRMLILITFYWVSQSSVSPKQWFGRKRSRFVRGRGDFRSNFHKIQRAITRVFVSSTVRIGKTIIYLFFCWTLKKFVETKKNFEVVVQKLLIKYRMHLSSGNISVFSGFSI